MPQQGSGKFVFPNGSIYAGEWQLIDDTKKRHGFGRLQFGKEVYIGEWKEVRSIILISHKLCHRPGSDH